MAKGVYAKSGICLTCRRYSPKSLGNCKIVRDARESCSEYLKDETKLAKGGIVSQKKKRTRKKKQKPKAPFMTDERTTVNAILKR